MLLLGCSKDDDEKGKKNVECPEGYMGAGCSTQITPSKITITKIQVTKFPQTNDGSSWDVASGPDIFVKFKKGTTLLWESSTYHQDAISGRVYDFTPSPSIELTATDQYKIEIWDYDDLSNSDLMGIVTFYLYDNTNGFPSILERNSTNFSFKFHVTYAW
jgi:hypothetical protein